MKTCFYQAMMLTSVFLLAVAMSNFVEAKPGFGGGDSCANCHNGSTDGALNVLPSDLLEIFAGDSQSVTFEFTDIPSGEAALALTGMDDPLLGASFGAGWSVIGSLLAPDEPFISGPAPQSYILELSIDAGATLGDYSITGQIAGDKGFTSESWADTFDFTVRVLEIPEPASIILVGMGLSAVGIMRIRRIRHRKKQIATIVRSP